MKELVDNLANQRSLTATSIWTQVRNTICSKYEGLPVRMMTKTKVIARVDNQRHGGRRADRLQDIENPNLALSSNGMNSFLCFNTPVYDPSAPTVQHRLAGWSHYGLRRIFRYPGLQLFIDATFQVVPLPFKQLLIIMARDAASDMYLPVFYILMTGKSAFLYKFALQMCVAVVGGLDIASVCCDFEKALMQGIKGFLLKLSNSMHH